MGRKITYADAGVDIDKGNRLIPSIKSIAKTTSRSGVIGEIGGFGGLYSLNTNRYERPVLVSSTDGVGTKLKLAFMMQKHDTVGIDLVAMSVNDIAVQGAKPLFFLDYISIGKMNEAIIIDVIKGVAAGCNIAQCSLIGGETAEMPGFYKENEYDIAGFAVGIVDNSKIIDGTGIRVGNYLVGIASSGLHSNGFSLVRKLCFEELKLKVDDYIEDLGQTIGECLLTPTKIYSDMIQPLIRDLHINGLAHITGGGLIDNLSRILPNGCSAEITKQSWDVPPIFLFLQDIAKLSDFEMQRTFNCGIGLVAVVHESEAKDMVERLNAMNEQAWIIGRIIENNDDQPNVLFV